MMSSTIVFSSSFFFFSCVASVFLVRSQTTRLTHMGRSCMNNEQRWSKRQVMVQMVQWTAASTATTVTMVIGGGYSSDRAEKMDSSHARHQLVNIVTKSARSGEPSPITDWMVNPDNKQLAFAPSLLPFDPPTFLIERQPNRTCSETASTTAKNDRCFVLRPTTCWSCSCR